MAGFKLRYASHLGVRSSSKPLFAATLGTLDPVVHIEYAAAMGFAGIEDNCLLSRAPEEQVKIGEAIARFGIEMGCFCSSLDLHRRNWVSADAGADAAVAAEIDRAIEAAERVNGRYIVLAPPRDPALSLPDQQAALIRHLRQVTPRLEKAGVLLCLEQTAAARVPGMLLEHVAAAAAAVAAVEHPAVKLLFDFFHVQTADGNSARRLEQAWADVAIIQIANVPGRGEVGCGEIDWPRVLRRIVARGYAGLLEYEIFPRERGVAGEAAALESLRRVDAAI